MLHKILKYIIASRATDATEQQSTVNILQL